MWVYEQVKSISLEKSFYTSFNFTNFFRLNQKTSEGLSRYKNRGFHPSIITIIIENSSLRKLNFKESKSWNGIRGIYKIPESINPGELVTFDFRRESLAENQGVVVYQIVDPYQKDYVLIIGWSKPNHLKPLNHAFVKIMLMEDYQHTSLEKIQTWIDSSSGQSYSIANGYSACAKAISTGNLPLWVNCLNSYHTSA